MQINVDLIYPIGSIYMTTSTVSPAVLFGGTWERIKGRCIVGVDENDTDFGTASKTGGEKTHKLTITEMPKHNHPIVVDKPGSNIGTSLYGANMVQQNSKWGDGNMVRSTGGDGAHNNLQPYYTAFIWRRTA